MRKETALTSMVTGMVLWGFANPFSDISMSYLSPAEGYFLESVAGALAFIAIVAVVPRLRKNIGQIPWRLAIPLGLIMPGLCFYLGNIGYQYGTVTIGVILLSTEVMFTALGGAFILGEKLSPKAFMAILMGMVGVVIVGVNGQVNNPETVGQVVHLFGYEISAGLIGALGFITSAFFSGLYAVYVRKYAAGVDIIGLTIGQLVSGAVFGIAIFFIAGLDFASMYAQTTGFWAAIVAGLLGSAFAFLFFNMASEHVTTRQTAMTLNLIPVIAIAAGAVMGRGIPTWIQVFGAVIVLCSLFFLETDDEEVADEDTDSKRAQHT